MRKILIANRGEIAVRIIRTCRDMGLASVAVYSHCDRNALHVRLADDARAIGSDLPSESYLRIDTLIEAARASGADAVHPGYGFLAENAAFAEACRTAGLVFIGPPPEVMRMMGSKTNARTIAARAGVPIVPGTDAPLDGRSTVRECAEAAAAVGYPLLVKAVAGGGGKGMRTVRTPDDLGRSLAMARSEARSAFGDDAVYFERLIEQPRHIEVQLLGDTHGTVVPFVERECSLQRRHQKLVEESPSASVGAPLRATLMAAAAAIGREAGYVSAGTIEFLVDARGNHYFLEMNTRLQVEHPVTEAISGVDFVREQIEIAGGKKLDPVAPAANGHAIECRVYAEDPDQGFLPSPGLITHLRAPSGPGVRDDTGAFAGWVVPTSYDPLISKVIAWAPDRPRAIARIVRALDEYEVRGIKTTIAFCRSLIDTEAFRNGDFDTTTVDRLVDARGKPGAASRQVEADEVAVEDLAVVAAALYAAREATRSTERRSSEPSAGLWSAQARRESLR